jgi:glycerol kinase
VAWQLNHDIQYALEGSIFVGGSLVQWIRDGLGLIQRSSEIETLAKGVADAGGVTIVPGFVGLGAPHWDATATGLMIGLSRGTQPGHIAQATLNALACQVVDVVSEMRHSGLDVARLSVDGGATENEWLMQRQADLLGIPVDYVKHTETTAIGAAMMAGLGAGFWQIQDLGALNPITKSHSPQPADPAITDNWLRAIDRAKGWNRF